MGRHMGSARVHSRASDFKYGGLSQPKRADSSFGLRITAAETPGTVYACTGASFCWDSHRKTDTFNVPNERQVSSAAPPCSPSELSDHLHCRKQRDLNPASAQRHRISPQIPLKLHDRPIDDAPRLSTCAGALLASPDHWAKVSSR